MPARRPVASSAPTLRSALAGLLLASASLLPFQAIAQTAPPPPPPSAQPPGAAKLSDQGEALRAALQRSLDELTKSVAPDIKLNWRNSMTVMPEGDGFRVELPYLTVVLDDGSTFDVGIARMRASPADRGRWRVSAAVPERIKALAKGSAEVGTLTLGSQRMEGLWAPEFESLIGFDIAYENVIFKGKDPDGDDSGEMKIGRLAAKRALSEEGNGRWTGGDSYRLEGVSVTVNDGNLGELGSLEIESKVGRADLAAITALAKTVTDMSTATASKATGAAAPKPDAKPASEMQQNIAQALEVLGKMGQMVDSFSTEIRMKDLSVTQPGTDDSYSLGEFGLGLGVEGIGGAKSSVRLSYQHNGIEVGEAVGIDPQYLPNAAVVNLVFRGLPNEGLWQAFTAFVSDMQTYGETAAGAVLGQKMMGLLATSESEIAVEQIYVNTDLASANMAGTAKFVPGSAFGVVAGMGLQFEGMKKVIALLTGPELGSDPEMKKIAGVLQLVSSMGKKGDKEDVLIYEIKVGPKGEMLLNDNDMSALLGLASGQQPPAQQQQRPSRQQKPQR